MKPSKCEFKKESVLYLGHVVTPQGVHPDPDKVDVIKNMKPPETVKQVPCFLGMVGYYRRHVPIFGEVARPLTLLTRKNVRFQWSKEAQEAFNLLEDKLIKSPILAYPDVKLPYSLYTDSSNYAIGAVLCQQFSDEEKVIQYLSHQLYKGQQKWPTIEREAYAIVYSIKKLRHYLFGAKFTVFTDHKPL